MCRHELEIDRLPGYRWHANGQSAFSGPLLDLYRRLDSMFTRWAAEWDAEEHRFPVFLPADELNRLDYFQAFPHVATFPVTLDGAEDNLARFAEGGPLDDSGALRLTRLVPPRDVLTPAACYHFYVHFQEQDFAAARYLTTRATCFRREREYRPLQRQWSFSMREIVCLGTREEVEAFLAESRRRLTGFFAAIDLPVEWLAATDPFFRPARNPKHLAQVLDPLKTEMVFADGLAIGSVNFHRSHFGEAFGIGRGGQPASSGCVAFGLERWMYAILSRFGADAREWPLP